MSKLLAMLHEAKGKSNEMLHIGMIIGGYGEL